MKKARYSFVFARKGLDKSGRGLVQLQVYFSRNDRKFISTGFKLLPGQWDSKKQVVTRKHPNFIRMNLILQDMLTEIETFELETIRQKKTFTKKTLEKFLHFGNDDFFSFAKHSILHDGKLGSLSRQRTLMHLETFRQVCGPVALSEINYSHIKAFDNYLQKQNYRTNTIGSYHKSIKRTINALIREGEIKYNPYNQFSITRVTTRRRWLTPDEVQKLAALNYDDGRQETLDRFLIACGTGLRFSDCYMLHADQIAESESGKGLVIDLERMKKVEHPVRVPAYRYFNGIADERLRKYLAKTDDYLFYLPEKNISAQNAIDNHNLKSIAADAGLIRPVNFHASRHTALTEVAVQTGNVFSVMKFGGIRKVETAMIYIHMAEDKF